MLGDERGVRAVARDQVLERDLLRQQLLQLQPLPLDPLAPLVGVGL